MTFVLSKKTLLVWQLRIAVAFVLVCLFLLLAFSFNVESFIVVLAVLCLGLGFALGYVPIYIKNYKIVAEKNCLYISKGVIFNSLIVLPKLRMVIVKEIATPLMRWLNVKIIMLKVAKGWIVIPDLENQVAKQLLDLISGDKNAKKHI